MFANSVSDSEFFLFEFYLIYLVFEVFGVCWLGFGFESSSSN